MNLAFAHVGIQSAPATACIDIDETDLTKHTERQIDGRLTGRDPTTDLSLFTTRGTGEGSVWVRNASVWTNEGNDIDWTGISPYNTTGGYHMLGTLISPRHIIMAEHYGVLPWAVMTFVDKENRTFDRTVMAVQNIAGTDIRVGVLNSDVPDSITYYPIMPYTLLEATLKKYMPQTYDIPIVVFDQEKKALVHSLNSLWTLSIGHSIYYNAGIRSLFGENIISGDSGNPGFILIDDQPVLLFAHYGAGSGPDYGYYINEINAAMVAMGNSDGYQVTEYSPACFTQYVPNNVPGFKSESIFTTSVQQDMNRVLHTIAATDPDVWDTFTYSMKTLVSIKNRDLALSPSDYFSLDPNTGEIRQIADLDNVTMGNLLSMTIEVNDNHAINAATKQQDISINIDHPLLISTKLFASTLDLVYSSLLDESVLPDAGDFVISVNGTANPVTAVSVVGKHVKLTLTMPVMPLDKATLQYMPSGNTVQSTLGAIADPISSVISIAHGNPGDLDNSFVSSRGSNGDIYGVAVQQDGKILAVGQFTEYEGQSRKYIARLNADGSLDETFNPGTWFNLGTTSVVVQSDRKILVGGVFTSYDGESVWKGIIRLNPDGSRDETFNPGTGTNEQPVVIIPQSDGKILIGGTFSTYDGISRNYIARIHSDGSLDETFDPGTWFSNSVSDIEIQPDGQIVVGGLFSFYNGVSVRRIVRLNNDATIDTTFNAWDTSILLNSLELTSDGQILVWFFGSSQYQGNPVKGLFRINSDGSYDPTLVVGTGLGLWRRVYDIFEQPDGKIIFAGSNNVVTYGGISRLRLVRIYPNGDLDTTFDTSYPGGGADSDVRLIVPISDDSILIAGGFTTYQWITRNKMARVITHASEDNDAPEFTMQFFADAALTVTLSDNASVKVGSYFLKITANETLASLPTISIDAEGEANDIVDASMVHFIGNEYVYEYSVVPETAATGDILADISISGVDTVGNVVTDIDPVDETMKSVYTDTTVPSAPQAPDLVDASDYGQDMTDNITALWTPTYSVDCTVGETIRIFVDNIFAVSGLCTASPWLWLIPSLADGKHMITATATDEAGNESLSSTALLMVVDTVAPQLMSAAVDGTSVRLTFDEILDANAVPSLSDISVSVESSPRWASNIALESSMTSLLVTLSDAVTANQSVTIGYVPGVTYLRDIAGNTVSGFVGQSVANTTAGTSGGGGGGGGGWGGGKKTTTPSVKVPIKTEAPTPTVVSTTETKFDLNAFLQEQSFISGKPATRESTVMIGYYLHGWVLSTDYICKNRHIDTVGIGLTMTTCQLAEKSQDAGLISRSSTKFKPLNTVSRIEAYSIMMKSICVHPVTNASNWKTEVIKQAMRLWFTVRNLETFNPERPLLVSEMQAIARQMETYKKNHSTIACGL